MCNECNGKSADVRLIHHDREHGTRISIVCSCGHRIEISLPSYAMTPFDGGDHG